MNNLLGVRPSRRRPRGITLVELLVALVIVGLLAFFGIPVVLKYSLQGRLSVAQTALKQIARQQAEWLDAHKHYATLGELGYPAGSAFSAVYLGKDGSISGSASGDSIYRIVADLGNSPNASAPGSGGASAAYYLLTAEPINGQAKDTRCGTLSLASTGQVGATGAQGEAACWQR